MEMWQAVHCAQTRIPVPVSPQRDTYSSLGSESPRRLTRGIQPGARERDHIGSRAGVGAAPSWLRRRSVVVIRGLKNLGSISVLLLVHPLITACAPNGLFADVQERVRNSDEPVATPRFDPTGGIFSCDIEVAITDSTPGASIHYTTDNSVPNSSSPTYVDSIPVAGNGASVVVKALATKKGMVDSAVVQATYTINYLQTSTPQFSPAPTVPPTVYGSDLQVTISDPTPEAIIYYTTDGTSPTTSSDVYGGPITITGPDKTATINAVAVKPGMSNSTVASGTYSVRYLYSLTVNSGVGGSADPSGTISVAHGVATDINASPIVNYGFAKWTVTAGTGVTFAGATSAATTVTLTAGDAAITANFGPKIETVAGCGVWGFYGDGLSATVARLDGPLDVAVDSSGNLYIADTGNNRIRKINTSGIITTVAGTGAPGILGDDGPATSAELKSPGGVAVDASGNLFIADTGNNRIRKVNSAGIITRVAGSQTIGGYGGDGYSAIGAGCSLNLPTRVAVDSAGNLFIADRDNHRIRKVDTSGIITTVAGNGTGGYNGDSIPATSAELWSPVDVAVDASGNLYIADAQNCRVRKVDHYYSTIGTVVYDGVDFPSGVAVDSAGDIYVSYWFINCVRKGTQIVAGDQTAGYNGDGIAATAAQLYGPGGVALDSSGNLYIADTGNHRIRRVP